MDTVIINVEEWQSLSHKIDRIAEFVEQFIKRLPADENAWLSEREVCDYLKISSKTLQRLRKSGDIKFSCIGRKCHYRASEVNQLIEKKAVKSVREQLEELKRSQKKCFRE